MNRVILTGRLTATPELRYTQSNTAYCRFTLAVRGYQDNTQFINCEVWKSQAENLCKYQTKGNMIGIEGRIETHSYELDGEKRYSTNVVCNNVEFLTAKKKSEKEQVETIVENDPFEDFEETVEVNDDFLD